MTAAESPTGCASSDRISSPGTRRKQLSLTHNFIWTLGGNILYAGCQWAVVVALAKIANPELVGQYALALAVGLPITFIANLQLRTLFVTDLAGKYPFYEMLGLRYMLSGVALGIVLAVCRISHYENFTTGVILIVALAQIIDCLSENYYGTLQRDERLDRISVSLTLRSVLSASALIVIVYLTHNLLYGVCGLVWGRGLVLVMYDARLGADELSDKRSYWHRFEPRWQVKNQLRMAWIALPLGVVSILVALNGNAPRYVIEHWLGPHQLGIYSAISYIPSGCFMIATALGYAVFARLTKLFFAGELTAFRTLLLKTGAICAGLGVIGLLGSAVLGRFGLRLLYRPEYAEHVDLLLWLMVVGAVQCLTTCLGCALTAASEFRVQVPIFVSVAAGTFVGCMILVPRMGLVGAAVATLSSAILQLALTGVAIQRAMAKRGREHQRPDGKLCAQLEPALEASE